MKRYELYPGGCVMLTLDEGDPAPSADDIAESGRLQAAVGACDPDVDIVPSDAYAGCRLVSWKWNTWKDAAS